MTEHRDHLSSDSMFFFHYALSPARIAGREPTGVEIYVAAPKLFPQAVCMSDTTRGCFAGVSATTTWISFKRYTRQAQRRFPGSKSVT